MYYTNNDKYDGEWSDGMRHGMGIYYLNDGGRYEGMW